MAQPRQRQFNEIAQLKADEMMMTSCKAFEQNLLWSVDSPCLASQCINVVSQTMVMLMILMSSSGFSL